MNEEEGKRLIKKMRDYRDWNIYAPEDKALLDNELIRTTVAKFSNDKKGISMGDTLAKLTKTGYQTINKIDYPNVSGDDKK